MIPVSILDLADLSVSGFGILFDTAVKGSALVGLAAIAAWLLRNRSAAARHAAWTAAVIGHLALPVVALVAPAWRLPLIPAPGWLSAQSGAQLSAINSGTATPASGAVQSAPVGGVSSAPSSAGAPSKAPTGGVTTSNPERAVTQKFAIDLNLPTVAILALIWLVGAFLVLSRLAVGTFRVSRLAKEGERVDDGAWLSLAQRLANRMSISRPLTLFRGERLGIPVTWGVVYPAVLLPPDADRWPEERRRFVLVHEMAHVKRFDALTQLAAQLTVALFWFDPLLWVAAHRMRVEREHACDDYVLRDGTKPSLYAGELLEMVQSIGLPSRERAAPAFAALAMARRSEFEGRMLSILDPRLDRHTLGRRTAFMTAAIVVMLVLPLAALRPFAGADQAAGTSRAAPTLKSAAMKPRPSSSSTVYSCDTQPPRNGNELTHVHVDDDEDWRVLNYMTTGNVRCEEASLIGFVRFSPDERRIVSLPVGGLASFRERTLTIDRTVTVTRAPDGSLVYAATWNGRPAAFNEDARAWLSQLLPRALRESAIDAKYRVARLRAEGGVSAVLAMIRDLKSTNAKRSHYIALISSGLSQSEREMVVRHARQNLASSETDLTAVLRSAGGSRIRTAATPTRSPALLRSLDPDLLRHALTAITSDGDRVSLLSQYVQTDDPAMLKLVLNGVNDITSSGDKRTVLVLAAPRVLQSRDESLHRAFFNAVADVTSSGDQHALLIAALPYGHVRESITIAALRQAANLSSDGDKTAVLVTAAQQHLVTSDAVMKAYLSTTNTISSSSDVKTAMAAILNPSNR